MVCCASTVVSFYPPEKEFEDGGKHRGVVSRQVDTNVIAITFNTLVNAANVHAGDVVVCSNTNCTAILSHLSKLTDPEGDGAAGKKVGGGGGGEEGCGRGGGSVVGEDGDGGR